MEEGGGDVKLVAIVPTPAEPPLCPLAPLHFLNIHSPTTSSTLQLELTPMCDRATGKHSVLGLPGCAVLIGVLIEGDYEYSLGSNPSLM